MPADLKGIKLRVPEGKWRVKMFQAYGANPSPMKFSELFTALQTGVMDGQENPFTQIYSAKLQEMQKFLSLSGHVYTPAYLTVGKTKWESLPADVRKILEDTAKETQAFVYETAREGRQRPARQAQGGRHAGQRRRQGRVHRGEQARSTTSSARRSPGAKDVIDRAVALGQVAHGPADGRPPPGRRGKARSRGSARATAACSSGSSSR